MLPSPALLPFLYSQLLRNMDARAQRTTLTKANIEVYVKWAVAGENCYFRWNFKYFIIFKLHKLAFDESVTGCSTLNKTLQKEQVTDIYMKNETFEKYIETAATVCFGHKYVFRLKFFI